MTEQHVSAVRILNTQLSEITKEIENTRKHILRLQQKVRDLNTSHSTLTESVKILVTAKEEKGLV